MEIKQNLLDEGLIELTKKTDELFREAQELFNFLDNMSKEIVRIESTLKELKTTIEFELMINDEDASLNEYLCWGKIDKDSHFRLIYILEGKEIIRKPFCECNLQIRLKNFKYLPLFVKEFARFLNDKNQEFREIFQGK